MTIKDIPSDVVAEMLLYIYTGNTPNLNKLAGDLLGAAEQYQLEMLKNICEEKLCSSLEIDNSVNHLILGDLYRVTMTALPVISSVVLSLSYQAHNLKRMSLLFVVRNMSTVVRSKDWKESLIKYPVLMAEVMEAMARKEAGEGFSKRAGQSQSGETKRSKSSAIPVRKLVIS